MKRTNVSIKIRAATAAITSYKSYGVVVGPTISIVDCVVVGTVAFETVELAAVVVAVLLLV